ncbi:MAG TPA: KpsF/GutQ family sugar-phosphate isomerase [Candidatus Deferrimicrobiaceae bacterium]|nr:KpsF/GutQ family sugar-phosphate isomerase [Candidatus Deferrimicrobiaceae bacterium]
MGSDGRNDRTAALARRASRVLSIEAEAITGIRERLDENFSRAIDLLLDAPGKVILTGVGKSGLIGRKIAATFASTGTPAFFLHPAEGIHGDIGMVRKGDIVIALSNSGETEEIVRLLPVFKRLGLSLIALTGSPNSTLARHADVTLDAGVREEACPLGLAPTASTTAALALGDALAVVLFEEKGFSLEDFALLHPGGALGHRLQKVEDVMHRGEEIPLVLQETPLKDALFTISSKRLGVTGVVNGDGDLLGVITDGDVRRAMARGVDLFLTKAGEIMTRNPKRVSSSDLAAAALRKMEEFAITSLFVFDENDPEALVGIVHIHDLLKAGAG